MGVSIRVLEPSDHSAVLELNEAHVELLSPLDEDRLRDLVGWSERALVIEVDDAFAGFVLTFTTGSAYDGENFAWFVEQFGDVAYLDRIVLTEATRRRGVATAVYDVLERDMEQSMMCLEVNADPPNEASLAFHRGRGYHLYAHRESHGHVVAMMGRPRDTGRRAG